MLPDPRELSSGLQALTTPSLNQPSSLLSTKACPTVLGATVSVFTAHTLFYSSLPISLGENVPQKIEK